jgi:3-isopropylmalate/(R)-2-methylmalate dehydratase small subunit
VGENFGTGSSREHVPHAMLAWGIRCVLGKSFARIFYRNCINLGLPAIVCPEAVEAAEPGVTVRIDTDTGAVQVGDATFRAAPLPPFMRDMLASGGLVDWARRRLAEAG